MNFKPSEIDALDRWLKRILLLESEAVETASEPCQC